MPDDDQQILSPDDDEALRPQMFTLRVLWAAMVATTLVYVVICYITGIGKPRAELPAVMIYALGAVAVALAVATPFVRAMLMPPRADSSPGPGPTRKQANLALARLFTALVASYAMTEAIAVFGLILSFLTRDLRYVVGFAALALVCLVAYFPRTDLVRAVLRGAEERPR